MTRTYCRTTWTCDACDEIRRVWGWEDELQPPTCPQCGRGMVNESRPNKAPTVIGDACDLMIEHAICHPDGTPRHFTSKSEMKREAAARGYMNVVEHKPLPGTDKSKWTTRWI